MTTHETSGQQRSRRPQDEADEVGEGAPAPADALKERQDKLDGDVDSILDEIDEVLEENAEEWVRGFVQKGGQ